MSNSIRRCWKCFTLTDRWETRQIKNAERPYTIALCHSCLKPSKPSTSENPMKPDLKPIAERVEGAIARLQAQGKPFSTADVCKEAGIASSTLYKPLYSLLFSWVKDASIASGYVRNQRPRTIAPDIELPPLEAHLKKFMPPPDDSELQRRIDALEQSNEELLQRGRELRAQLSQAVQIAPTDWLEREVAHWRSRTAALDEQICQMQEDLDSAQRNLESCERILRLSREAIEGAEVFTSNGNGVAHARA